MTSNNARKRAIRALQQSAAIPYSEAARRIDRSSVGEPTGCYVVLGRDGAGNYDESTVHFGTIDGVLEYWSYLNECGSETDLSDAVENLIHRREQPCLLIVCADCCEIEENDNGGPMHCLDQAERDDLIREFGYYLDDEQQPHCSECMDYPVLTPGQRLRFADERKPWTVRAIRANGRYAVLTRAIPGGGSQYTIMDFALGIRGADNAYARYGYTTDEQITRSLDAVVSGEIEISHRHWEWLRYADEQPDALTVGMLDQLRARAWRGFTERPERQNAGDKIDPEPPTGN